MPTENNVQNTIVELFGDTNFIEEHRLSEPMEMEIMQGYIEAAEGVLLFIDKVESAPCTGQINFTNETTSVVKMDMNNEPANSDGGHFCHEIDCTMDTPVKITYRQYIKKS